METELIKISYRERREEQKRTPWLVIGVYHDGKYCYKQANSPQTSVITDSRSLNDVVNYVLSHEVDWRAVAGDGLEIIIEKA